MTRPFPTIEVSDPQFEHGGVRHVTVFSRALGRRADCTLWAPADSALATGDLPLVVLLHGVYASHWAWSSCGGAPVTAARLIEEGSLPPCVLAMPSDGLYGHGSGYLDQPSGGFERWIVEEVPLLVSAVLGTGSADQLGLVGLSMGGFGALSIGASHSGLVVAAAGMSSITEFDQMALFVRDLSGYDIDPARRSVLATILDHRYHLPALHIDCGADDLLFDANSTLHAELAQHGIPHDWHVHAGGHSWDYWRTHVRDALVFCGRHFRRASA